MSKLWYEKPANEWVEATPLGNGRLGAMIFGNPIREHIQVNEESMWYGGPVNRNNPDLKKYLPKIREYIFKGEISKAEALMQTAMSGCPESVHPYQTLGDIYLDFKGIKDVTEYRRELDLEKAVCTITFVSEGVKYTREIFISKPADCMIMRFTADCSRCISFSAGLGREKYFDGVVAKEEQRIHLFGNLGRGGSEFAMKLHAQNSGGIIKTIGEKLIVEGADEVILTFTADTTYHYDKCTKENAIAEYLGKNISLPYGVGMEEKSSYEILELRMQQGLRDFLAQKLYCRIIRTKQKSYDKLIEEHIADYHSLFGRARFELSGGEEFNKYPTDVRIEMAGNGTEDIGLVQLYFDFGRYLLISCSREDGLPANLQGIWNKDMLPPWDSKYTININAQMNYWPAESCNLSECHMPLFGLLEKMVKNGRKTAREMYGCRGFVAHHNTDYQADTAPQDVWVPGTYWVMGAAWLCTHQWTHYEYTKDLKFLKRQFPIMCEAALFFLDFMVEKDGYLVTCPSVSPENTYILENGEMGANGYGVTMDNQILRDLFTQCEKAYHVLLENNELDQELINALQETEITDIAEFINQITKSCSKLKPTMIGKKGTILEWQEEYEEWEPGHRHISHLYGLHPSEQITMDKTPELAQAAAKTLEFRLENGGGHTGWSRAWIINHYAKLWDGEKAYEHIRELFAHSTYPNMFDKHPPFQIDGNFGATAAIAEMVLQSSLQRTVLLPALPQAWKTGSVKGLCIKGNAVANIAWENNKLRECIIEAHSPIETMVRYRDKQVKIKLSAGEKKILTEQDFL